MGVIFEGNRIASLRFLWKKEVYQLRKSKNGLKLESELMEYFEGKRKNFSFTLGKLNLTNFEKKVLKEVLKIPYGKTLTYQDLAKRLGNPLSARAVGNALRKNPVALIIPCHRVVAKRGIGGYCGKGHQKVKEALLRIEGIEIKSKDNGK